MTDWGWCHGCQNEIDPDDPHEDCGWVDELEAFEAAEVECDRCGELAPLGEMEFGDFGGLADWQRLCVWCVSAVGQGEDE